MSAAGMHRSNWTRRICSVPFAPALVALLLVSGCTNGGPDYAQAAQIDPNYRARMLETSGISEPGFGEIRFLTSDGKTLEVLTYRAQNFDQAEGPIWFVMHGASRDAERYIKAAAPAAERNNALTLVIRFTKMYYPSSSDYTLGITTSGRADANALRQGRLRPPEHYLYAEVEYLFDAVRQYNDGRQSGYYLFGHSAGAQFTHRLATFVHEPRAIAAVAANAGWYTLPVNGHRPEHAMPYGLDGSPVTEQDLYSLFSIRLAVMLGERDTTTPATDRMVRGSKEAMAQGPHRLARGEFYFASATDQARRLGQRLNWELAVVPRAKHSAAQMIDSAASFLFRPGQASCETGSSENASTIVITEILADPPRGIAGDANGDGLRDASDDEFVEIVNTGTEPVCLTGWTLGDTRDPERHVFPLGSELAPGAAFVVFGGGAPTGTFGRSETLTAQFAGRLSLTNDGDVLTLRNRQDVVVSQVSWGDCAEDQCASDHISNTLGIKAAVTRESGTSGKWLAHKDISDTQMSPGLRSDGTEWR